MIEEEIMDKWITQHPRAITPRDVCPWCLKKMKEWDLIPIGAIRSNWIGSEGARLHLYDKYMRGFCRNATAWNIGFEFKNLFEDSYEMELWHKKWGFDSSHGVWL